MSRGVLSAYSKRKRYYLLHFNRISKQIGILETDGELSYISPAMFFVTAKKLRDSGVIRMHLSCHEKHIIEGSRK